MPNMDEQKAKYILSGGRPRELDADQEGFHEALGMAEQNPAVREWMEEQQTLTETLNAKLNEIPVPVGLKDRILAGESVSRTGVHGSRRSILALAAIFVGLLSVMIWQFIPSSLGSEKNFAGLRTDMAQFLSDGFSLELQSKYLEKLKDHLSEEHQFVDYVVPEQLAGQNSVGCRIIEWQGSQVALICFTVDRELVHLMVLPKDQLLELPEKLLPRQAGEWATDGWQDEKNVYLVATRGSADFLESVLDGTHSSN